MAKSNNPLAKSSYQIKIEKELAKLAVPNAIAAAKLRKRLNKFKDLEEIPTTIVGGDEFRLDNYHYSAAGKICDLCGHNPIKRIFVIENVNSGKKAEIGSECATNYIDADIIDGLSKVFNTDFLSVVNPIKFEKEVKALEYAIENRIELPRRLRWNLINSGSPRSALAKIKNGKPITKKEKEVLGHYLFIYENKEAYAAVTALGNYFAARKKAIIEAERIARIAAIDAERAERERKRLAVKAIVDFITAPARSAKEAAEKTTAEKAKDLLANNRSDLTPKEVKFLNNVVRYAARGQLAAWAPGNLARIESRLAAKASGTPASDDTKDLFDFLFAANLNFGQKKFVSSVYSFYKRTGFITDKQKSALERNAKALGYGAPAAPAVAAPAAPEKTSDELLAGLPF